MSNGYPTRKEAEKLLEEAGKMNPGPWVLHCETSARCAEILGEALGLKKDKAYVLGLLHDIGRRYGKMDLGHIYWGFIFMRNSGYTDVAKVTLSHSFPTGTVDEYIGKHDVDVEKKDLIVDQLSKASFDDYDLLIQLCDCLAGCGEIMDIEERMKDVEKRYGFYPVNKKDKNREIFNYFKELIGEDIYTLLKRKW